MKKIVSLSRVFIKEFYQNLAIFDKDNKKFNKKSLFFWLIVIVLLGIAYVSFEIIKFLVDIGQPEIFLNIYFMVLAVILIFQAILICGNVFFFSKDMEKILHMPLKPTELLLAKFTTLLSMLYATEIIFGLVPMTLYGLLTSANFMFSLWEIIILGLFPILIAAAISIILLIIMRFIKFVRNKDAFQVIVTMILIAAVCIFEFKVSEGLFTIQSNDEAMTQIINLSDRAQEINKYFLIVNPSVEILLHPASFFAVIELAKLLVINIAALFLLILVGKFTYLKGVLNCMVSHVKKRKKHVDANEESKSKNITKAYIEKEFKLLIKNPTFFMQCVFPVLIILMTAIIVGVSLAPIIIEVLNNEEVQNAMQGLSFNTEIACGIVIIMQVLFSISNISLTAISRDGKSATFMKYIPIDLYTQFIYKNIPQIVLNLCISIVVLGIIWYLVPSIGFGYIFAMFVSALFINLINSYLMLIVDLRRPNLDWDNEYTVVKNSNNKLFQYAFMIINVLVLMYIATIFKEANIVTYLIVNATFYAILFIIIDRCVKKWKNKLFNKII